MPRRSIAEHGPHPVDVHVGGRVRLRRKLLGMSQTDLGNALGVTFQQVQKYERGANRISASRLYELSQVLDAPISYFFDDMPGLRGGVPEQPAPHPFDIDETQKLVRAFFRIRDPKVRGALKRMAINLAEDGAELR